MAFVMPFVSAVEQQKADVDDLFGHSSSTLPATEASSVGQPQIRSAAVNCKVWTRLPFIDVSVRMFGI